MILEFDNKKIEVREEYIKTTVSKSSGRELNNYRFKIKVVGKEKFENFKRQMNKYKEKFINQIDSSGKVLAKFNIGNWSYRYYNEFDSEEISYLCEVEIIQGEELKTDILVIEGVKNEVLKYKEEYDDYNNAIIITAVIKNTEEQRNKINNLIGNKKYFKVIRPGINDVELEMRFGKTIWSKHENFIKRNIILVEKSYDENDRFNKPLLWPEMNNMMTMLAKNIAYINNLEKLLKDNSIVSEKNIAELKAKVEKEYKDIYRDYYLVDDAEADFD